MDSLLSDLRVAARGLLARPSFTIVAVATLALGVGATTALFGVVDAVLLEPLPYPHQERLVWVTSEVPDLGIEIAAGADYLDWRDQSQSLEAIAAWDDSASFSLTGTGAEPERVRAARVSAGLLPLLGVAPERGRGFAPDEDRSGGPRLALAGQELWRRIGGDGSALGRSITLDGEPYEVVGVLPAGFALPGSPEVDLLVPLALDEARERGRMQMSIVRIIGRLAPEVAAGQARAELQAIQTRARERAMSAPRAAGPGGPGGPGPRGGSMVMAFGGGPPAGGAPAPGGPGGAARDAGPRGPGAPGGPGGQPPGAVVRRGPPETRVVVLPLAEHLVGDLKPALLLLLGAVGFVLLIACANVANLLLARAAGRGREMAVRAAIGAGRGRLVRHLLAESLVLGLAGGAAGLAVARAAIAALPAIAPAELAQGLLRWRPVELDGTVFLFTLGLAVGTAALFGLAPAVAASRPDLVRALKDGGSRGRAPALARRALVAVEVALAVVLLAGAGLLVRSFLSVLAVDPGFSAERVLTVALDLAGAGYESAAAQEAFFGELAARVDALPGVEAAAPVDGLPLAGFSAIVIGLRPEGAPPPEPGRAPQISLAAVGPDYFRALGVRLAAGRAFTAADAAGAPPVAIVSESLARRFWADEDPIGRRFLFGGPDAPPVTVVGVAADVRAEGLESEPRDQAYFPFAQRPRPFAFLAVRTAGDPTALVAAMRREVAALDAGLPVWDVATMERRLADSVAPRRFNLLLATLFAGLALTLAAIGLYGVLAHAVAERTQEIGVRMALGARRSAVVGLVVQQGLATVGLGAAIGLVAALAAVRLLSSALWGVTPHDPVTFAAVPALLGAVGLVAAWAPARRATRVDPVVALRE